MSLEDSVLCISDEDDTESCISDFSNDKPIPIIFDDNHLHVYLRIKNGVDFKDLYEITDSKTLMCKIPDGSHVLRNAKDGEKIIKKYSFSRIFAPPTNQIDMFDQVVKNKILGFINGCNSTLLTYGASGAGKTFTIVGTASNPGVIPRSLEYLFRTLPSLSEECNVKPCPNGLVTRLSPADCQRENKLRLSIVEALSAEKTSQNIKTYKAMQQRLSNEPVAILDNISEEVSLGVWVSFAEIYNEHIYDLLQPDPARGKTRPKLRLANSNGHTYIKNLTNINVTSGLDAYQILQYGLHNLNYAETKLNSHSSRSHSIFTVRLAQASDLEEGGVHVSSFHFCDLAGAERTKKTMNVGERLKESNNINTSLMVLGRCIKQIRCSQKQSDQRLVPFRESKLTQLFQRALSGHEEISMIVNINPSRDMFDETHHVLNFSAIAKNIIVEAEPKIPIIKKKNRFSEYIQGVQGRSTAIAPSCAPTSAPIMEDDQSEEIERLQSVVTDLLNELEANKLERDQTEEQIRDDLMKYHKEQIAENDAHWKQQIKQIEIFNRREADLRLEELRFKYEKKLEESNKRARVIEIEDSDDESETVKELYAKIREHNGLISNLQQEVTKLRFEKQAQSQEIKELQDKLKKSVEEALELKKVNKNLEETLEDAKSQFLETEAALRDSENKLKESAATIFELKEREAELEDELATLRPKLLLDTKDEESNATDATQSSNTNTTNVKDIFSHYLTEISNSNTTNIAADTTKNSPKKFPEPPNLENSNNISELKENTENTTRSLLDSIWSNPALTDF